MSANQVINPFYNYLVVHARNPVHLANSLTAMIHSIDRGVTTSKIATLDRAVSDATAQPRSNSFIAGVFGALALLLAASGTYSLMAHSVAQRTKEMAIRMAVGAEPSTVFYEMVSEGLMLAGGGILVGLAGGFALSRLTRSLLFGTAATDAAAHAFALGLIAAACLAACLIPAWRAMRVNPATFLRGA